MTKFLSLAESFGCKLLSSNTSRLANTLNEFSRIKNRDVYVAAQTAGVTRVNKFVAEDKKFDEAAAQTLNGECAFSSRVCMLSPATSSPVTSTCSLRLHALPHRLQACYR